MANAPNSSMEDLTDALSEAITLGSHGSFIWHWARQGSLPFRLTQQWLIQQVGLKSLVQLSIQSFGQPQPPGGLVPTFADPETRAKYLENVEALPRLMSEVQPELITWTFLHETDYFQPELLDLLSEQELQIIADMGIDMTLLFIRFNGMGLRELDGTPKPAWFSAIGLDFGY